MEVHPLYHEGEAIPNVIDARHYFAPCQLDNPANNRQWAAIIDEHEVIPLRVAVCVEAGFIPAMNLLLISDMRRVDWSENNGINSQPGVDKPRLCTFMKSC